MRTERVENEAAFLLNNASAMRHCAYVWLHAHVKGERATTAAALRTFASINAYCIPNPQ